MDWKDVLKFLVDTATSLGIRLLTAGIVLLIGIRCIKSFLKWLKTAKRFEKLDEGVHTFLLSFSKIGLYLVLVITTAMVLGIPATSFITVLASCGVAIGLALQGSLSNFAGGLMILLFKPFVVGDFIETDTDMGRVTAISVVYTTILTPDNKRITIPNGTLTNSVITNYSAEKLRRVDIDFSVSYNCDINTVEGIIREVINKNEMVLKEPEPFVRFTANTESSMTFTARVWCNNLDYWDVKFDLLEKVKLAFDEKGIEIPYNQLDVHITNK